MIRRIATPSARFGERGIALSKRIQAPGLSVQLLGGVVLSLLAAAAAFGLFFAAGSALLDHTVYGESFSAKMSDRRFAQLQSYVEQEGITTQKLQRLNAWCSRGGGVYLTVYEDGALIYESPAKKALSAEAEDYDPESEDTEREYTLTFADGVTAQAFLYYFAGDAFYLWMTVISGLLAFALFSICFVALVNRKLRYIKKLKKELDILAGGDLDYPVTVKGQDELGELAAGIDEMRRSIQAHRLSEEEARAANSQLVAAMSHDLRTPLTSLLAFLEILDREKITDEEQQRHLIRQSLTKALSIKSMADKLFSYFLVYASEGAEPALAEHPAQEVFAQSWQEYAFALESHGFTVETHIDPLDGDVRIDPDLLHRAFDNLYANLVKYADPDRPIRIACRREAERVHLTLSNVVSPQRDAKESTNIGLNTCRRILDMHRGSFETAEENGIFTVCLELPLTQEHRE